MFMPQQAGMVTPHTPNPMAIAAAQSPTMATPAMMPPMQLMQPQAVSPFNAQAMGAIQKMMQRQGLQGGNMQGVTPDMGAWWGAAG